ncbi:hypothetical protein VFPBJ_03059 [Purpureocillium lilacinum]|uniref:Uncharacterized protein n=1 Tax=Purpureocillium lilacinum TaxID=33203 RepID=A0A179H427_PURLI|nr:hypothetical protein VFPBJ_03059 [Purpureocillium lilacinum]
MNHGIAGCLTSSRSDVPRARRPGTCPSPPFVSLTSSWALARYPPRCCERNVQAAPASDGLLSTRHHLEHLYGNVAHCSATCAAARPSSRRQVLNHSIPAFASLALSSSFSTLHVAELAHLEVATCLIHTLPHARADTIFLLVLAGTTRELLLGRVFSHHAQHAAAVLARRCPSAWPCSCLSSSSRAVWSEGENKGTCTESVLLSWRPPPLIPAPRACRACSPGAAIDGMVGLVCACFRHAWACQRIASVAPGAASPVHRPQSPGLPVVSLRRPTALYTAELTLLVG